MRYTVKSSGGKTTEHGTKDAATKEYFRRFHRGDREISLLDEAGKELRRYVAKVVSPAKGKNPAWLKMGTGFTLKEATARADKLKREDRKLRSLGGSGNYERVEVRQTFERPSGAKEYGVFVVMRENPGKGAFKRCVKEVAAKGTAESPRAVCSSAARKKYGQKKLTAMAIKGKRAAMKKHHRRAPNASPIATMVEGQVRGEVEGTAGGYWSIVRLGQQTVQKVFAKAGDALSWTRGKVHELAQSVLKKNPLEAAQKMFQVIHGFPAGELLEIHEKEHRHEYLAGIGPLIELKVRNAAGQVMTLTAPDPAHSKREQVVWVAVTEEDPNDPKSRQQIYFVGGDQSIPLDVLRRQFGLTVDDIRDHMVIGPVEQLTYRTRKSFELGGKQEVDFWHDHGKEHAKRVLPILEYKPRNPSMELVGGRYYIAPPEKELGGASPGIVG